MTIKTVKEIIDTEYRSYAMYVLENRAIPSMMDGFKSVHRKLLYSMLNDHKGKKVKIVELGSIGKHNYHHGETSAMAAAVGLSQDWNNNEPIFTGHGNFGSRLVQEAAAPRYIYASLADAHKKYFIDDEVAPAAFDADNPEPAFYLPIIPWVLINGISGIAVGFATNILPHSVKNISEAVLTCLLNPSDFINTYPTIIPTFPSFRGKVILTNTPHQFKTEGIIAETRSTEYLISELPIGYDRETYITFLGELVDNDKIRDFIDECSENGFAFRIKVSASQKSTIKDVLKFFKLEKFHTQNLTTLGTDGKLRIFNTVNELIYAWVQERTRYFDIKLEYDKNIIMNNIEMLTHKKEFLSGIRSGDVDVSKMSKSQVLDYARSITTNEYGKTFINIPMWACTHEAYTELEKEIISNQKVLDKLKSTTGRTQFLNKIKEIQK